MEMPSHTLTYNGCSVSFTFESDTKGWIQANNLKLARTTYRVRTRWQWNRNEKGPYVWFYSQNGYKQLERMNYARVTEQARVEFDYGAFRDCIQTFTDSAEFDRLVRVAQIATQVNKLTQEVRQNEEAAQALRQALTRQQTYLTEYTRAAEAWLTTHPTIDPAITDDAQDAVDRITGSPQELRIEVNTLLSKINQLRPGYRSPDITTEVNQMLAQWDTDHEQIRLLTDRANRTEKLLDLL